MSLRQQAKKRQNPKQKVMGTAGWSGGLQELSHPSAIEDNELAEAQNVEYNVNGELKKRRGSVRIGSVIADQTKIATLQAVYQIGEPNASGRGVEDPQDYFLAIGTDGYVYLLSSNDIWSRVEDSPQFTSETTILQALGKVYFLNQTDNMCYWNGVEWHHYTAIANPTAPLTAVVTKEDGAVGNRTLYYYYAWFNEVGNTASSLAIPDGEGICEVTGVPNVLDNKNYVTLTIPRPAEGDRAAVTAVGLWKGTYPGSAGYLPTEVLPEDAGSWVDYEFLEADEYYQAPKENTTAGFHFKFADTYRNSLMGVTKEYGDDTIVFSANDDKFGSFGRQDGGGYYGWRRGEGLPMTGVKSFSLSNQDYLFCFKRDKIGAFQFDESGGSVKDINLALGTVSHKSIHQAAQDLRFWSENGVNSLRNEANYATIIRVASLSIKADDTVKTVTALNYDKIVGCYFENLSVFSIPMGDRALGNNACLVYDERFSAWSVWKGMKLASLCTRVDPLDNVRKLYGGSSEIGKIYRLLVGKNDDGLAFTFRVSTKQFSADKLYAYKKMKRLIIVFGYINGLNTGIQIVADGNRELKRFEVISAEGFRGFGSDEWGIINPPNTLGTFEPDIKGLIPRYANLNNRDLFTLQVVVENDGADDEITVIGAYILYTDSARPLTYKYKLKAIQEL